MKRLTILLCALALAACATKPSEQLPHYPCKDEKGRYYACTDQEWVMNLILRGNK